MPQFVNMLKILLFFLLIIVLAIYIYKINRPAIVISFSSFGERINGCLPTLVSLANQTFSKGYEIHFFAEGQITNKKLLKFIENQPKIIVHHIKPKFKSFSKLIYALDLFKNSPIAVCDDDQIYHKKWLSTLYNEYNKDKTSCYGFSSFIKQNNKLVKLIKPIEKMKVLWTQGYTGYIIPPSKNFAIGLKDFISKHNQNEGVMVVDDVVIGSWLNSNFIQRFIVPRNFSQKNIMVKKELTISDKQDKFRQTHDTNISEDVYNFLYNKGLF